MKINEAVVSGLVGSMIGAAGGASYGVYQGVCTFAEALPSYIKQEMYFGMHWGIRAAIHVSKESSLQKTNNFYIDALNYAREDLNVFINQAIQNAQKSLSNTIGTIGKNAVIGAVLGASVGVIGKIVYDHLMKKPEKETR